MSLQYILLLLNRCSRFVFLRVIHCDLHALILPQAVIGERPVEIVNNNKVLEFRIRNDFLWVVHVEIIIKKA